MATIQDNWNLLCSKLERVNPSRNGIDAIRPAHDDKKPA